jgi:hypothetical protein
VKGPPGGDVPPDPAATRPIAALLARHWLFVLVLVPAIVLRTLAMLGFRWALWFNDSYQYVEVATGSLRPDPTRPSGYAIFLRILEPLHSFAAATSLQHLMGIGMGVMIYALLRHRFAVPAPIATLAAVPALFDAYQIQLEHLIMADTPFAFLLTAAVTIVMWNRQPGGWQMAAAGLLLGIAAVTRSIGLPLLAIIAGYLLISRVRLRVIAACVLASLLPVGGYVLWFHDLYHEYALTQSTGVFLYSRVMAFADCTKFTPPPDEMALCTTTPQAKRMVSQLYIWSRDAPLRRYPPPEFSPLTNKLAKDFSMRAIKAQPLSYARVTWDDTWRAFAWKRTIFPDPVTYDEYQFASASRGPARYPATGQGYGSPFPDRYTNGGAATRVVEPYAGIMRAYQKYFFVPGTILGVLLAIGLGGMALAWRRLGGEILLPWSIALALIVVPAATVEFDYRYTLPAVPFASLATAIVFGAGNPVGERLAARRDRRRRRSQTGGALELAATGTAVSPILATADTAGPPVAPEQAASGEAGPGSPPRQMPAGLS